MGGGGGCAETLKVGDICTGRIGEQVFPDGGEQTNTHTSGRIPSGTEVSQVSLKERYKNDECDKVIWGLCPRVWRSDLRCLHFTF